MKSHIYAWLYTTILLYSLTQPLLAGDAPTQPSREDIINAAAEQAKSATWLSDTQRDTMTTLLTVTPGQQPDHSILVEALSETYPQLRKALIAYNKEDDKSAEALFTTLLGHEDPYLASHAAYYVAAIAVRRTDYESAKPLLERLLKDHSNRTLFSPQILYWLGESQYHMLELQSATQTLNGYRNAYPNDDPARTKSTSQMLDAMKMVQQGKIMEAEMLMQYSHRRLALEDTGKKTQAEQKKIVSILDQIITKMEEEKKKQQQQQQQQQSSGSQGQQGAQPGNPNGMGAGGAKESNLPPGESGMDAHGRVMRGDPRESWGSLPEKERKEIENMLKERFPQRYREIIEQYYVDLQEEGDEE